MTGMISETDLITEIKRDIAILALVSWVDEPAASRMIERGMNAILDAQKKAEYKNLLYGEAVGL
jgi:hypothetical protein